MANIGPVGREVNQSREKWENMSTFDLAVGQKYCDFDVLINKIVISAHDNILNDLGRNLIRKKTFRGHPNVST